MNHWKQPLETVPKVEAHPMDLDRIRYGGATLTTQEAAVLKDDEQTPVEIKTAISQALELQARRGLILSMGFIN